MTPEALAEQLGGVNASTLALSSRSYVEARIAVTVSADTGKDSTALAVSQGLPVALASSLLIASDALSFTQEPHLLAPPSAPPLAPPEVADVRTPTRADADARPDELSDRSSPATSSSLIILFSAVGGGLLLLITIVIVWKRKPCRLRPSSTATWMTGELQGKKGRNDADDGATSTVPNERAGPVDASAATVSAQSVQVWIHGLGSVQRGGTGSVSASSSGESAFNRGSCKDDQVKWVEERMERVRAHTKDEQELGI